MNRKLLASLAAVVAVAIAARSPAQWIAPAGGYPDFDLRLSEEKGDLEKLEARRARRAVTESFAQTANGRMRAAREALAREIPGLTLVDSAETGAPEVVGIARGRAKLTPPTGAPAAAIARQFVTARSGLYGLTPAQAAALELDADFANPAGNLSWVRFAQRIHGLPVFRGTLTLALTRRGEIARTTGQLAAGLPDDLPAAAPTLSAAEAIAAAAATVGLQLDAGTLAVEAADADGSGITFGAAALGREMRAELLWFPLGPGAVELAWMTVVWDDPDAYLTLVSAEDGTLLFRKNGTAWESFTYHVYDADSPAPLSPTTADPSNHLQATQIARSAVTVESENLPGDPWLSSDATMTGGNNVWAGVDRVSPNGIDPGGEASVTGTRTFDFDYDPAPDGADDPLGADFQDGAVTNLFFWSNRYHDRLYDLGFTEQAYNFQDSNYGRGGVPGDRVWAEAQDSSGTSNANFSTQPDGTSGRMQMYLFDGPTPVRDGALDTQVVIHELTHGTSSRLHFNATGLATNMSAGLGEGWSDFYALSLVTDPADDPHAAYAMGGYATFDMLGSGYFDNYWAGIRRFPRAPITTLGGPGNLPVNPQTFADIDQTQIDLSDGAFPPVSGLWISTTADQVHAAGEVWSSALWEARTHVVDSLGGAAGNQRMLQVVTDGMKLDPASPTFLQARDSILAADCAGFDGEDELDLWAGFAARGIGRSSEVLVAGSNGSTRVVEAFDGANLQFGGITVTNRSCADPDREPLPGEVLEIAVEVENPFCGHDAHDVVVSAAGGSSSAYGDLVAGANASGSVYYSVPTGLACDSQTPVELAVSSDLGSIGTTFDLQVGPHVVQTTTFSNAAAITIPDGAPGTTSGPASLYPSQVAVSGIADPVLGVRVGLEGLSHTWPGDLDLLLVAPSGEKMVVLSDAWGGADALAVDILLDDEAAAPVAAGATPATGSFRPADYGSGDGFDAPAPAGPYLEATTAGAATFASAFSAATPNGLWSLYIRDDAGSDTGELAGGWSLDILTAGTPVCAPCISPAIFADGFESGDTVRWTDAVFD